MENSSKQDTLFSSYAERLNGAYNLYQIYARSALPENPNYSTYAVDGPRSHSFQKAGESVSYVSPLYT